MTGVWGGGVMEQILTGLSMPAYVVYSHTAEATRYTLKAGAQVIHKQRGKRDVETDRGTCIEHAHAQQEGLFFSVMLEMNKVSTPLTAPPSLEDANPSQYSSPLASLITFSHPDSPSHNNKSFPNRT